MPPDFAQHVFSLLGQLVAAGGGGAIVAYAIFKFLGKSWIEHELARDLEAAKSEIGLLAARRLRLHDREYVVFPEIWAKLNKSFHSLGGAIVSYREIPDFSRKSEEETAVWVSRSNLSEEEKDYFTGERDKIVAYNRILDWRSLVEASGDFVDFRTFFHANRIFLSPEIKEKLDQIDSLMNASWTAKKMVFDGYRGNVGADFLSAAWDKYDKEIRPLIAEIEGLVQARLFPGDR